MQELPDEILGKIVQNLMLCDRIRLSLVCKSWTSLTSAIMNSTPLNEFPWLVLPQSPDCKNDKTLSFCSLSNGKVVDLKLPEPVQGGWFCGSSKGLMIKEQGLNSQMLLFNPVSRALHQLPSLATIPCFKKYVKKKDWKLYGVNFFFNQVLLSTSNINSDQCVVAATFSSSKNLALCRPGDKTWSVFRPIDYGQDYGIGQLLFSSGKLYALIGSKFKKDTTVARTLRFGDHALELMMVYCHIDLIVDPLLREDVHEYRDHTIYSHNQLGSYLFESTNNEVLLMIKLDDVIIRNNDAYEDEEECIRHGDDDSDIEEEEEEEEDILEGENEISETDEDIEGEDEFSETEEDILEGEDEVSDIEEELCGDYSEGDYDDYDEDNDGDEELYGVHNEDPSVYTRTSYFYIYKIDSKTDGNNVYTRVQSLGDQILFLAGDRSAFSLSSKDFEGYGESCIYFASKGTSRFVIPNYHRSREIGTFYLDTGKIMRSFPSIEFTTRSRIGWYVPS